MRLWLVLCFLLVRPVRPCDPSRELCGSVAAEKAAGLRADLWKILNGATKIDVLEVRVCYTASPQLHGIITIVFSESLQ